MFVGDLLEQEDVEDSTDTAVNEAQELVRDDFVDVEGLILFLIRLVNFIGRHTRYKN